MNPVDLLLKDPSIRRYVLSAATIATVALNKKLDLGLTGEDLLHLMEFVGLLVLAANTKAVLTRARAASDAAAAQVVPGAEADAVVDAAAKGAP